MGHRMTDTFRCDRQRMTLSTASCAKLWDSAQRKKPEPWESRFACRNCPVGAAHAGKQVEPMAAVVDELRQVCPRCTRWAGRLINGRLCVSCYNREREVLR